MTIDPNAKVNFESASILLVESSQHSAEVLAQIFTGFGARNLQRAHSVITDNGLESMGVNSKEDLEKAKNQLMKKEANG